MPPSTNKTLEGVPVGDVESLTVTPMGGGSTQHSPQKSSGTITLKMHFTTGENRTSDVFVLSTVTGPHDDSPTPNSKPEVSVHPHPDCFEAVKDLKHLLTKGVDAAAAEVTSSRAKRTKCDNPFARSLIAAGTTSDMLELMKRGLPDAFPVSKTLEPDSTWKVRTPMRPTKADGAMFECNFDAELHKTRGISGIQIYLVSVGCTCA